MTDKLELILKTKDLSASQLADETGIQRSIMSHVMNGRNKASLDFIQRILKRFPDINPDWLLFGKGTMSRENNLFNQEPVDELDSLKQENDELKQQVNRLQETVQRLHSESQKLKTSETPAQKTPLAPSEPEKDRNELRDEEPPEYRRIAPVSPHKIETIIVLYDDQSFKEYQKKITNVNT